MNIQFLGTGTSTGVPTLCCDCEVCRSSNPRNKRLRASVLVRQDDFNILIDTSTDLRQQCLTNGIGHLDAVLFTHHHADHVNGIDELRCFNHFNGTRTPVYAGEETLVNLRRNFNYIFSGTRPEGGGIPQLDVTTVDHSAFNLGGVNVLPVDVHHGTMMIKGYRLNDAAYLTDCSGLPDASKDQLKDLELLILNAVGFDPHPTHFCLSQALDMIGELKPKRTLLTHINHRFDHDTVNASLPETVELAYDGLVVEVGA